ncbi:MAG: hypothetical protein ACK5JD_15795, partial [Mangrovibacterium sp.]
INLLWIRRTPNRLNNPVRPTAFINDLHTDNATFVPLFPDIHGLKVPKFIIGTPKTTHANPLSIGYKKLNY